LAKFEKTGAYACSGTARRRPLAVALHNFFSDRGEFFARRDPERRARMNRDEIRGKAEKAKGYIKEETGEAINDPELEAEGRGERAAGKLREGFGKAKRKVGEAVDDIVDEVEE
jgi:uncharacterized protein YjbJ (UPF0337 family)